MLKLNQIKVSIDDLLLDPNNPRLVTDLHQNLDVPDELAEEKQEELLRKFSPGGAIADDEEDFLKIESLMTSMSEIGYVGIDRIVVRKAPGGKFIVLEGNRRTATIKILREKNRTARDKFPENISQTFEELDVMELPSDGVSPTVLRERLNVILGIRHYGSLLEWEPLPKAYNMFHNYMGIHPTMDNFTVEQIRIKEVASRLSIKATEVRKALKTYIAFLQLAKDFPGIRDDYYSLIQAAITNTSIAANYLTIDDSTYKLDEASKEKLNSLCQFEKRGTLDRDLIIVRKPQEMKLFGDLVKKSINGPTTAVMSYATGLISQLVSAEVNEETGKLTLSLENAVNALKEFEANTLWVDAIAKLLDKQESELEVNEFMPIGNDLFQKNALEARLEPLRRIYGV